MGWAAGVKGHVEKRSMWSEGHGSEGEERTAGIDYLVRILEHWGRGAEQGGNADEALSKGCGVRVDEKREEAMEREHLKSF